MDLGRRSWVSFLSGAPVDGAQRSAHVDHQRGGYDGVLKVTGVEKGADCQITFPDLDQEAWEKA